jgi:hypothetical protein
MSERAHGALVISDGPGTDHGDRQRWPAFCSSCGRAPEGEPTPFSRVCEACGMGLILRAPPGVAPGPTDAFLVVEATLAVGAVSSEAERFLDVAESHAIHRPVAELIEAADAEAPGESLAAAIMWAARGDGIRELEVRPAHTFGVRCRARIGPCGPPRAAVLVFSDS